jgi:hypothetical protein
MKKIIQGGIIAIVGIAAFFFGEKIITGDINDINTIELFGGGGIKAKNLTMEDLKLKKNEIPSTTFIGIQKIDEESIIYVSNKGDNQNKGTAENPLRNIDIALEKAEENSVLFISGGIYSGHDELCKYRVSKNIRIFGGFTDDFKKRDWMNNPTVIKATKNSAASSSHVFTIERTNGLVELNGLLIDMGEQNKYEGNPPSGILSGYLVLTNQKGTPKRYGMYILGNNRVVKNNVFVNISNGGIHVYQNNQDEGKIEIANNVFVANGNYGIECGSLPGGKKKEIEIHHNTFAFMFGNSFLNNHHGNGIKSGQNSYYNFHHNIIAYSSGAGILYLNQTDSANISNNLFYKNKKKDFQVSIGNTPTCIHAEELGKVKTIQQKVGNINKEVKLPLEANYLAQFERMKIQVDESELEDAKKNGSGTATTKIQVGFFANKYPYLKPLEMFGSIKKYGAQL